MQHADEIDVSERRPVVPSWALSVVIHLVLILMLGWLFQMAPRGAAEEAGRSVGIVLKRTTDQGEEYEGEDDQPQQAVESTSASTDDAQLAALPNETNAFKPADALPSKLPVIGAGALEEGGVAGAGDLTRGAGQPKRVLGGRARTQVYGVEGEGNKFIYVFDRSVSMDGAPLASAKQQLLASLNDLESTHQFQIVFFHHKPRVFDLSGGQNRIPFATDRSKQLARNFVGGITADGGTDRLAALELAVGMRPDVVFFLTDVDNPMTSSELERIRRKNRGTTSINTIEFGFGPSSGDRNFLIRLAADNSGKYVYVDTSKLGRQPKR